MRKFIFVLNFIMLSVITWEYDNGNLQNIDFYTSVYVFFIYVNVKLVSQSLLDFHEEIAIIKNGKYKFTFLFKILIGSIIGSCIVFLSCTFNKQEVIYEPTELTFLSIAIIIVTSIYILVKIIDNLLNVVD